MEEIIPDMHPKPALPVYFTFYLASLSDISLTHETTDFLARNSIGVQNRADMLCANEMLTIVLFPGSR